ncbi:MAG TPA: 3-methyl-2-oxobutanoate hydroxymethyltransferase [bacterium]|nr:3-methyl-2-oxobutanoate hydroxymethyltransferase [bacterium]
MSSSQVTVKTLLAMRRRGDKITMVTAYDYHSARVCDAAGIEMILVGDTLGMVIQGHENTLPVTVDDIVYHARMVRRADPRAFVVADMPFLSYQVSVPEAVANAGRLVKDGRAQAVKLEGGREFLNTVGALTDASIPVMGHLGLTPQSIHRFGGFRVQGRSTDARKRLLEDASLLERAGCFSLVLEGIPFDLARQITESLSIPTIGIGAGPHCDGQVLVFHDLLGIESELRPKFVKRYAELNDLMIEALATYRREVKSGEFPDLDHSYGAATRRAPRADHEDD